MLKPTLFLIVALWSLTSSAQLVAKMQVTEDIPGVCDKNEVYAFFPMFGGQEEAVCPVSEDEILRRLNAEVQYIKDHPKFKAEGMIGLIINCDGKLVQCKMDNKTGSDELDKQIEAVFNSLGEWKAGKLEGFPKDSSKLYSLKIRKGVISFD